LKFQDSYEFPFKRFFWCLASEGKFQEFTELNDQHFDQVDNDSSYFLGEPTKKLNQTAEGEGEEENPPEEN
jgi:hypothetical protein